MTPLSPHFSLEGLTFSQEALRKGIDNTPSAEVIENLRRLCGQALEPARSLLAVAIHVDSGYRSPVLNTLVGGASNSAHMDGRAADIVPIGADLQSAFAILRASAIPFDKLIIECNAWLHISVADEGQPTRRQAMTASGYAGHWVYTQV